MGRALGLLLLAAGCGGGTNLGGDGSGTDDAASETGDDTGGEPADDAAEPPTDDGTEGGLACEDLGTALEDLRDASGSCSTADDCAVAWVIGDCDCAPTFPGASCAVALPAGYDRERMTELRETLDACAAAGFSVPRMCDCGPPCTPHCEGGRCIASCGSCLGPDGGTDDGDGGDDSDVPSVVRLAPGGSSFLVSAALSFASWPARAGPAPTSDRFTLRLTETSPGVLEAVAGAHGETGSAVGTIDPADPSLVHMEYLYFAAARLPAFPCSDVPFLSLAYFDLRLLDADGDGAADGLEGSASGYAVVHVIDIGGYVVLSATLTGVLDEVPPELSAPDAASELPLFDALRVWSSEPLPADTTATLEDGAGYVVTLEPCRSIATTFPSSFCAPDGTVFPPGAELSVRVSPELRDLAGNVSTAAPLVLRTIPDPGALAEDGFEGPVRAWLWGDASLVTGVGTLPALSGARSVRILPPSPLPRGGRMIVRLALTPGDTGIAFRYRILYPGDYDIPFWGEVRAGPVGAGTAVALELPDRPAGALDPTGDPAWSMASALTDARIDLPAGAIGEAWLDVDISSGRCGRIPIVPETGILLDDVRAE